MLASSGARFRATHVAHWDRIGAWLSRCLCLGNHFILCALGATRWSRWFRIRPRSSTFPRAWWLGLRLGVFVLERERDGWEVVFRPCFVAGAVREVENRGARELQQVQRSSCEL